LLTCATGATYIEVIVIKVLRGGFCAFEWHNALKSKTATTVQKNRKEM